MTSPATPGASAAVDTGEPVAPPRAECRADLEAYRDNFRLLRSRLTEGSALWPVVKADAYGHGVDRIAQTAVAAGARRLCVATLSEARHLRQQVGMRVPLLIMGPLDEPGLRRAISLDVSVSVLGRHMLGLLEHVAGDGGRPARVHLKVDTGMGRWGVAHDDAGDVLDRLVTMPGVEVEGVMTHFATADDEGDGRFFATQLERFEQVADLARTRVPRAVMHAANSAAALREPRSHFDAVRCGVASYGLDPMQRDAAAHGLTPVLSLHSYVGELRERSAGESVGYERSFVAERRSRVAIVPIGYADGVRRELANRGEAIVRGRRRPLVGNVSMDQVALLVDDDVRPGDPVILIGRDPHTGVTVTAEDHAGWASTINYEITCGIAHEPRLLRTTRGGR